MSCFRCGRSSGEARRENCQGPGQLSRMCTSRRAENAMTCLTICAEPGGGTSDSEEWRGRARRLRTRNGAGDALAVVFHGEIGVVSVDWRGVARWLDWEFG